MDWFRRAWRGEVRLWKIFWLATGVVPLFSFYLLMVWPQRFYHTQIVRFSYYAAAWMVFSCWSLVPLWRCAPNTKWWVWTRLTRMFVVIVAGQILYFAWAGGFTDLSYEKRASVECRRISLIYAQKLKMPAEEYLRTNTQRELECRHIVAEALR
jgi:hypothetical protein